MNDNIKKTIWSIDNKLRGSVEGWEFKSYILNTLFLKFLSEKISSQIDNYSSLSDEKAEQYKEKILSNNNYFLYPSELLENVIKLENIIEKTKSIFSDIEKTFPDLFSDFILDSPKLGKTIEERNIKLKLIFEEINKIELSKNDSDIFGDTFEYLMTMYASSAGKSGGEFYTPQEVAELLIKIGLIENNKPKTIYDPTCGSGSLLLKSKKILQDENIKYYGQEINFTSYNLARINMILHNVECKNFNIFNGNTLLNPAFRDDKPFDVIVSNPPYSIQWIGDKNKELIKDERFSSAGILAPKNKGDLAFVMHCLNYLSETGVCAMVLFPGVLYRGGAEEQIRKYLIENNFVESVIQLPENLFFNTSIGTDILVLKKNKKDKNILFIDSSKLGNKIDKRIILSEEDINKILEVYKNKKEETGFSVIIDLSNIKDYNLSVNTYLEAEEKEEIDIIALNKEVFEEKKKKLEILEKELEVDITIYNYNELLNIPNDGFLEYQIYKRNYLIKMKYKLDAVIKKTKEKIRNKLTNKRT